GFPFYLAVGNIWRGSALAEQGQAAEGIAQIRQGLAVARATGAKAYETGYLSLLAEACEKVRQVEEGLTVLAEALDIVRQTGEHYVEARLHRVKGQLLLQLGTPSSASEAEACFHKAIDVARQQSAKSSELQAAVSLARLWQQQGKKDEARQMLTEIYSWFTEGFDTADLKEAKTLLAELA
ncbi:MAG: hypothetical protein DMG05_23405, partial [Acidobacteria bacterium]